MFPLPRSVGFSGWTTKQMCENAELPRGRDAVGKTWPGLALLLAEARYDLVVLMAGTNDLGHGYDEEV